MRFLFCALVVILMLFFNYIEISSGMNQEKKPLKTLQLFSEKPELLGKKSEENLAPSMRMNDLRKLQIFNERTENPVNEDSFRKVKPKFNVRLQDLSRLDHSRRKAKGVMERFNDNTERFIAEQEKSKHQQNRKNLIEPIYPSVKKNYTNFANHHAHANRRESEYADTASSKPRSETLASYQSYNEHQDLTPVLPRTAGYKANLLNQKEYPLYIDTPRPRQPPPAGHVPYFLNQGQQAQYYETQRSAQRGQFYGQLAYNSYYAGPSGTSESSNRH